MSIEDLIGEAVTSAGLAEADEFGELVPVEEAPAEPSEETQTETLTEEEVPTAAASEAATTEDKTDQKSGAEEDDLDKFFAGQGIQPKDGQGREGRIRYTRMKKMWGNREQQLRTELTSAHEKTLGDIRQQIAERDRRLSEIDVTNRLIVENPTFYLQSLLAVRPEYKDAIVAAAKQFGLSAAPERAAVEEDPRPTPDVKFADGSLGYSDHGLQKLLDWNTRQAVKQAQAGFEKTYGQPIQTLQQRDQQLRQQQQEIAARDMHARRVQQNVEMARKVYGRAFDDDFGTLGNIKPDSAIMKVMNDHKDPRTGQVTIGFLEACAMALIPKMQADRNKIREEVTTELRQRPAAARRAAPAAHVASSTETPSTVEGIITDQMRKAGMLL